MTSAVVSNGNETRELTIDGLDEAAGGLPPAVWIAIGGGALVGSAFFGGAAAAVILF